MPRQRGITIKVRSKKRRVGVFAWVFPIGNRIIGVNLAFSIGFSNSIYEHAALTGLKRGRERFSINISSLQD